MQKHEIGDDNEVPDHEPINPAGVFRALRPVLNSICYSLSKQVISELLLVGINFVDFDAA